MKRSLTILFLSISFYAGAQDIHFSQFYATPLFTNPAFTGHFPGTYRFSGVIRSQWLSVSAEPYQTFGGGFDVNGPFNLMPIGMGLHVGHDFAGLSNLTTTQIHGFLSGRLTFGEYWTARLGATIGFVQRSIDFSKLNFDDQFNGIRFDPSVVSSQAAPASQTAFSPNLGGGLYLERRVSKRRFVGVGYSLFNILEPNMSFYNSAVVPQERRHNIHVMSSLQLGSAWDFLPGGQVMMQGPQSEILLGGAFRYHLNTSVLTPRAFQLGLWGRPGDAGYVTMGLDYNNLFVGGSYDVNFSSLQPATNYRGGWELTIIYIIPTVREQVKRLRQCPDYL